MKNKILVLIVFSLVSVFPLVSNAQKTDSSLARNTIYVEAGGQGLVNSFSYDRLNRINKKTKTSFSIGVTIIPLNDNFLMGVPISYNFLFGRKNHYLELGVGFTFLRWNQFYQSSGTYYWLTTSNYTFTGFMTNYYSYFSARIGYRYQKQMGGIFFRVSFTPLVAFVNMIDKKQSAPYYSNPAHYEYFSDVCGLEHKVFPWAGISIGYTFKK